MEHIRSPICTVLGHVDHGKSKILDSIRGSNIIAKEAGGITQAIGASIIPLETVKQKCGDLLKKMNFNFTIPGLLFIDTPGHAAFTSLRKRGGNIADIAVLVVDVNEGLKPQTIEAIEILKASKTPFVIAANKIDLFHGWKPDPSINVLENIAKQSPQVSQIVETKMYELVGKLSEHGLNSERFDRVQDFTKQVAIVPVSAMTTEGISSLLMVIAGLTQRYMEENLHVTTGIGAKGTILEIKEEKGLGKVMDIIIYDGSLKKDDILVIGGMDAPIVTKVKMLLEPEALSEMRDKKTKYNQCNEVHAAIGVRVVAPEIDYVIAGMPVQSCKQIELEAVKEEVQSEVESALIETDREGIVIKADTIGSLEALTNLLREREIPIMKAAIGNISKKDIADAESNVEKDPEYAVVLGFNVENISDTRPRDIKIITDKVVYKILDDLDYYLKNFKEEQEKRELEGLVYPAKFEILQGYVFRQSNPAVCGVHIIEGKVKVGMPILKDGQVISEIKSIQKEKESVSEVEKGDEVAISMDRVTIGRQIEEGDILFSAVKEDDFRKFKELKKFLKEKEKEVLKEIASQMRKDNVVWGV
ncbi:translation initiation factor IF-2 [Candidatus Woesearchaeota archaeon]|nr:translation initiation factor IF-2 [Candidatus Woesearchaeota archaeon]